MFILSTPTHRFTLPFNVDRIDSLFITYRQKGNVIFEKTGADCLLEGNQITVTLSQQETHLFTSTFNAEAQLNILTTDGKRLVSKKYTISVSENLHDEVMR